ncbi:signal-regulatory protein beta-2-like [Archocentrus centrarchus]|uniref:signal-regulatory protein beta-2-like n=1 Tax=Archocentrus centrarchus TaxID=63155 RepID=UPI0011EA1770|nr:signal-regulatory protein beta-2-like [Archocentrus centrarchus]
MIVLWISLLFHQAYTLVPVKTVQLGEPANLTCVLPKGLSSRKVYWYKQSLGGALKLIVTLYKNAAPEYGPEFSSLRFHLHNDNSFSNLTILTTAQEDEGIYHCGILEWINPQWNGTYLLVKGNSQRTSNYTVVQWPTAFGPARPGDTATFNCSVLSDSDNLCPGYFNVLWFRAGSDKSHPNMVSTDRNRHNDCESRFDSQNRCVYRFSKNVSSSDAGTYYCAVAACGEMLFGNGTTLEVGMIL